MFSLLHSATYDEQIHRRSASAINPVITKNINDLRALIIDCSKVKVAITLCFQLCSACFTALQIKHSRRSAFAINPVTMENTDNSHREAITLLRIVTFGCQQKKWDTKKDKGKSMMRALYILWYAKRNISG